MTGLSFIFLLYDYLHIFCSIIYESPLQRKQPFLWNYISVRDWLLQWSIVLGLLTSTLGWNVLFSSHGTTQQIHFMR